MAVEEPLVLALATVTGHYRDDGADLLWLGSEETIVSRRGRGQVARERYRHTGEVEYVTPRCCHTSRSPRPRG